MYFTPTIDELIAGLASFPEDARDVLRSRVSRLVAEHEAKTWSEQVEVLHLAVAIDLMIKLNGMRH